MSDPSIVRLPFFFFLYSYTCFQEMFPKEKLLADFILRTECAFTTVESLNVSMFRLTPPPGPGCNVLAESLLALVTANLVICISTIYP